MNPQTREAFDDVDRLRLRKPLSFEEAMIEAKKREREARLAPSREEGQKRLKAVLTETYLAGGASKEDAERMAEIAAKHRPSSSPF